MSNWGVVKSITIVLLITLFSLIVLAEENLSITATPDSGNEPLVISFRVDAENQTIASYAWDFNDDGTVDSTDANPQYTYAQEGTYTVTVNITINDTESTLTKTITVRNQSPIPNPLTVSIVANPSSGKAPLAVQFTAAATGREPLTYLWDFNGDGTPDNTQQNPSTTFQSAGEYNVTLRVTDASGATATKILSLQVTQYDSKLNLTSYFPSSITPGNNEITFIVSNNGEEPVRDISGKIVGAGMQHLTSTTIPVLNPGDQDSLTVKINVLQNGNLNGVLKAVDKSFPITFTVTAQVQYNKEDLQAQLTLLRAQLQEQQDVYQDKKAEGYFVSEIFDTIKTTQKQLQDAQEQLLKNELADAKVTMDVASTSLADLTTSLQNARKQKVTPLMWAKDNLLAITAIIAALGTLGGILVKLKSHAAKVTEQAGKLTEDVKNRFKKKEEHAAQTISAVEAAPVHQEKVAEPESKPSEGDKLQEGEEVPAKKAKKGRKKKEKNSEE